MVREEIRRIICDRCGQVADAEHRVYETRFTVGDAGPLAARIERRRDFCGECLVALGIASRSNRLFRGGATIEDIAPEFPEQPGESS